MPKIIALVVEDSPINQIILAEVLEGLGVEVILADNGQQAVDLCKKHAFCIIFMDLEMPIMGGHDATQLIRKQKLSFAPIVAITAHEKENQIQQLKKSGFTGFLQKPIDAVELKRIIQSFVPPSQLAQD